MLPHHHQEIAPRPPAPPVQPAEFADFAAFTSFTDVDLADDKGKQELEDLFGDSKATPDDW